ncbi:DUF4829 domain-containing protein [Nocardioides sp. dk884]|uniref:DUF4829 domain-containing protein n=2 Tax=unclassified Nocardioides TaxID=2615069 RepID=UPI001296DF21|nr:DUF4829 domain-containing protein [Nocardioides sp. dk884]QGA08951.1 DUF4829 domain-containing protein [Nocardioides sp. dk884]
MITVSRRFVAPVVGVVVLVVVGVATYLLLAPRQSGDVAVPANDATPEQVVTAYLDALNAHDCDTAEAVMTSDAKDSATSWCRQVASLTDVDVRDHFTERPEFSGRSAPEEVVNVPVTFDLDWRLFHGDVSMPGGTTTWGYRLVRDSSDTPWRIFDQGNG